MFSWLTRKNTALNEVVTNFSKAPFPAAATPVQQAGFLAIDLELTGLNPRKDHIVSIGWVPMEQGRIILNQAEHIYLSIEREVGQSAVFHQIGDEQLMEGVKASQMLQRFMQVALGSVLVFHHAQLDMGYLNKLAVKVSGAPIIAPVVDTMLWEHHKIVAHYHHTPPGTLRLHNCRQRYHLPDYPAHDALTDALADGRAETLL